MFKLDYKSYKFKINQSYKHNIDPDFPIGGGYEYVLEASKNGKTTRIEAYMHENYEINELYNKILAHRNQTKNK